MQSLTVVFGNAGNVVAFMFKERKDAEAALSLFSAATTDIVTIKDDFGQLAEFRASEVTFRGIEDLDESGNMVIERTIQQAKTNIRGNTKAQNDPFLKLHGMNGGGALNHPGAPMGGVRRPNS